MEQIDSLYWRDVLSAGLPVRKAETTVKKEVDFTEQASVLPESWEDVVLDARPRKRRRAEDHQTNEADGEIDTENRSDISEIDGDVDGPGQRRREQRRTDPQEHNYTDLRENLHFQITRRNELRRKLSRYKKLRTLLVSFEKPKENIQPNLVTKDNKELEAELAKMRILLARVGSKIQNQQHHVYEQHDPRTTDNVTTDAERLKAVLDLG